MCSSGRVLGMQLGKGTGKRGSTTNIWDTKEIEPVQLTGWQKCVWERGEGLGGARSNERGKGCNFKTVHCCAK